jgi:hypothetical protein
MKRMRNPLLSLLLLLLRKVRLRLPRRHRLLRQLQWLEPIAYPTIH